MVKGLLDSTSTDSDFYTVFDNIVATNPQLNNTITEVRNESNLFLVKILRFYTHRDVAFVQELGTKKKYYCHLTHEMLSYEVSLNCMCDGNVQTGDKYGTVVVPYSNIYGIVANVRFKGTTDEKCLLACLNYGDDNELKSNVRNGEIRLVSGDSTISLTRERINLMTPQLFINGLPYDEPDLKNYYDKSEISIIKSDTDAQISELKEDTGWQDVTFETGYSNYYASDNKVQYRRIGKIVHIRGIFKNTSAVTTNTSQVKFASISDSSCFPSQKEFQLQQGTDANKFYVMVDTNGDLKWSRYGTTSTSTETNANSWLHCYITYFVD